MVQKVSLGLFFLAVFLIPGCADRLAPKPGGSTISTTSANIEPTTPSNLMARAISSTEIDINWADTANDYAGFEISMSTDGVNYTLVSSQPDLSYPATNLTPNTKYYFLVLAYDSDGNESEWSNVADQITTVPLPPTNLAANVVSSAEIDLTWADSSADYENFVVMISQDGINFTSLGTPTSLAFAATGLSSGTNYTFSIQAINSIDNESTYITISAQTP